MAFDTSTRSLVTRCLHLIWWKEKKRIRDRYLIRSTAARSFTAFNNQWLTLSYLIDSQACPTSFRKNKVNQFRHLIDIVLLRETKKSIHRNGECPFFFAPLAPTSLVKNTHPRDERQKKSGIILLSRTQVRARNSISPRIFFLSLPEDIYIYIFSHSVEYFVGVSNVPITSGRRAVRFRNNRASIDHELRLLFFFFSLIHIFPRWKVLTTSSYLLPMHAASLFFPSSELTERELVPFLALGIFIEQPNVAGECWLGFFRQNPTCCKLFCLPRQLCVSEKVRVALPGVI